MQSYFEITDSGLVGQFHEVAKKAILQSISLRGNIPFIDIAMPDVFSTDLYACDAFHKGTADISEQFFVSIDDGGNAVLYPNNGKDVLVNISQNSPDVIKIVFDSKKNSLRVTGMGNEYNSAAVETYIASLHMAYFGESEIPKKTAEIISLSTRRQPALRR